MAEFEKTCHLELSPQVDILQNGRRRVIRRFELGKNGNIDDVIFRAYQDPDPAEINDCTAGYANLRMIQQRVVPQSRGPSVLEQVFETLTDEWAEELDPKEETGENGRLRRTKVLIALPGTDASGYVVGTSTDDGLTLAQKLLEKTDGFWRLTLVYGDAGVLSRTTSTSNNGALSTIVIESANEVPATPPGYVLVGTQVVGEDGYETTRYTFVKGDGQVSQQDDEANNGKLLTRSIRWLSSPTTIVNPIATPSGYVLVSSSYQEADGHRVWSATFAKGEGEISRSTSGRDDGTVVTIRALSSPSTSSLPISAPAGFVLIDGPDKQEADGHIVWAASFAKGNDVLDTEMNGLRRRTVTAYYTPGAVPAESLVVGTTTHPTDTTLILAQLRESPNDVTVKRMLEYLQPGIVDATKAHDSDTGMLYVTFKSFGTKIVPTCLKGGSSLNDDPTVAFQGGAAASIFRDRIENVKGYRVFTVTVMMKADGTALATNGDNTLVRSYQDYIDYQKPGSIAFSTSTGFSFYPGGKRPVLVQVEEFVSTSGNMPASNAWRPFAVKEWAAVNQRYTPTATGVAVADSKGANGYLAELSTASIGGSFLGEPVSSGIYSAVSDPTPSVFYGLGSPILEAKNIGSFVTDAGQTWYRKRKVTLVGTFGAALNY